MEKIVVTGGSGQVGHALIKDLVERGYKVLNIDIAPPKERLCRYLRVDITDFGQICEALHGSDAVVHLGAITDSGIVTEEQTFRQNIASIYNVFSAAQMFKLQRVVWISSIQAMGFPLRGTLPVYAPVDEDYPIRANNSYALTKVLGEEILRQFHTQTGIPAVGFRFPHIVREERYELILKREHRLERHANELWSYLDVRDAAQCCRLALEADITGAEIFVATAADTLMETDSMELMKQHYPEVPFHREVSGHESLFSIEKARKMLGYVPQYSWRDMGIL